MLQRAGIAQAILHNPKLVFFDEPMSGLDPLGRREVRDLMEQLKQEGKTVFFSTHILSDAEALCDRVAIINKGELRGVGAVEDLTSTVQGKVEVIWQGTQVPASMKALGAECHVTGDTVRAVLPENQQDAAIDALRRERIRLIAITPLRTSLEAYFVEKMQVEKSAISDGGEDFMSRIVHIASNTFRRSGPRPGALQPDRLCPAAFGGGDFCGADFHRYRAPGGDQPGADGGFAVWRGHCDFHRDRAGLERDREAHALHRALAAGAALGIYCGQVLRPGRDAGGEYVLHGHWRIRSAALRGAQVHAAGCARFWSRCISSCWNF